MLPRLWLLLALSVLVYAAPCHADRVYRLVDYPANQNGHFLKGTITTTDAAPDDSLLDRSEILGWQWSISGPNTYAASSTDNLRDDLSLTTFARITPHAISLPYGANAPGMTRLFLSRVQPDSGGLSGHGLLWTTRNTAGEFDAEFSATRMEGDEAQDFWSGPATFPTSSGWIIAIAIPEPATAFLFTTCVAAYALRRPRFSCR